MRPRTLDTHNLTMPMAWRTSETYARKREPGPSIEALAQTFLLQFTYIGNVLRYRYDEQSNLRLRNRKHDGSDEETADDQQDKAEDADGGQQFQQSETGPMQTVGGMGMTKHHVEASKYMVSCIFTRIYYIFGFSFQAELIFCSRGEVRAQALNAEKAEKASLAFSASTILVHYLNSVSRVS